jgi:hypothetical protein
MQWGVDQQDLVATNAELPVSERPCTFGGHVNGLTHPVEHDKIIAQAVHFCEVPNHAGIIPHLPHREQVYVVVT